MAAQKSVKKWGGGSYVALPRAVLKSHGYANLSPRAVKLLNDLLSQYHGNNNGDLCAAMTLMKVRGWKSNDSLTRSRKELLSKGFTSVSKQGGRNSPTLYALTFYSVDECINKKTRLSRHDVTPTSKPANDWAHLEPEIKPVLNLAAAQKEQKDVENENNILHLKKHLRDNSNDKHTKQMEAGIDFLAAREN